MNVHDFLKFFTSSRQANMIAGGYWHTKGGLITSSYNNLGVPWEFRYGLAEKLIGINFGCNFKNSRCERERKDWIGMRLWLEDSNSNVRVNYCCSSCYITIGNLESLPNDDGILEEVAVLFDPEYRGFWRHSIGCTLSHKYRSTLCLAGRCSHLLRTVKMNKDDLMKIYQLKNIRSEWERSRKEQ